MKRVLLTGYNSFTGPHLERALEKRNAKVFGISISLDKPEGNVFPADFKKPETLVKVLREVDPTHIIDLAGVSFVGHGKPVDFFTTNVIEKEGFYNAIYETVPNVSRVIVVSSATVYGNRDNSSLTEDLLPKPRNHYGLSKAGLEMVGSNWKEKLPILITRPFNYTGAGQHSRFLIPKIVDHFRARKSVIELGNIDVFRDFSDVRDVSAIYCDLLEAKNVKSGEIFNICSGNLQSLRDIISYCSEITDHDIEITVNPQFVRKDEIVRLGGNPEKLKMVSGNVNKTSLRETLEWMLSDEATETN